MTAYNFIDITGNRYGRLTVLHRSDHVNKAGKRTHWVCLCDCKTVTSVCRSSLVRGATKSCGCFRREFITKAKHIHGLSQTPLHGLWRGMIERCHGSGGSSFSNYGGRGIQVCDRWRYSFLSFLSDMGERPGPEYSIDRINNSGHYSPENCRWVTRLAQSNNRRSNVVITYEGKTMTAAQWSRVTGVKSATICWRIRNGWDPVLAITTAPYEVPS